MTLWSAADAAAATGGATQGDWQATGVSIDTRTLAPGDLFVALAAARDGHEFVAEALDKGAAAALVSRRPDGVAGDAPLLVVDDVQSALEALGRAARARTGARVVAVTGSVGKTSTKEMLRRVLSGQGRTHAAHASYNNHWGVPLTLARMPAETDYAVIEIGMNHPGEIAPLSRLARPHVAVITTVAPAHLEAFDDIEGIAREKASILAGLEPGGVAIWNADVATAPILAEAAQKATDGVEGKSLSFGESAGAAMRLTRIEPADDHCVARAEFRGEKLLFKLEAPGRHFAQNGAAVLAVAEALGLDRAVALADLGRWHPGAGRGARRRVVLDPADARGCLELIDDAYNANPASVAAALKVLAGAEVQDGAGRIGKGRRIAVLGDMKELGPTGPDLHAALARHPSMPRIDRVHCVGPLMRHLHDNLPEARRGLACDTAGEMASRLPRLLDAGDVVLVKGSLSTGLSAVVDAIGNMGQGPARDEAEG